MNENTAQLRQLYTDEVADIRRVAHYNDPKLDVEEIIKRDVRLGYISTHFERFVAATTVFDQGRVKTGEDYFYVSFILSQEEDLYNFSLACMLAQTARKLNFFGNEAVPDMNEYIQQLQNVFYTKVTGLEQ